MKTEVFFLLSTGLMCSLPFSVLFFSDERQHLLSDTMVASHEVSLVHDFNGFLACWQNCNVCETINRVLIPGLPSVVQTASNLFLGKAPLQLINVNISVAWMLQMRHRDSDKPSCTQPCGRECPELSHDVLTAEDRIIMEFPSLQPQNKELIILQTQQACRNQCFGSL